MPDLPDRRKWQSDWPVLADPRRGLPWACRRDLGLVCRLDLGGAARRAKFNDGRRRLCGGPAKRPRRISRQDRRGARLLEASVEVDQRNLRCSPSQIRRSDREDARHLVSPCQRRGARCVRARQVEKGHPDYAIKTWTLSGRSRLSPERDEYFPVLYSTVASKAGDTRHGPQLGAARARPFSVLAMTTSSPPPRTSSCAIRSAGCAGGFFVFLSGLPAGGADRQGGATRQYSRRLVGVFQTTP